MNQDCFRLAESIVSANYIKQSQTAFSTRQHLYKTLLSQKSMPEKGWDDITIESFLLQISQLDLNNFVGSVGVGEREGRVFSDLVRRRHYYMTHGIGRSGDITANQPKAAGSSLILSLCNAIVLQAIKLAGCKNAKKCIAVPMCTGMSLGLVFSSLRTNNSKAKYILWPRIDQKSALKSIKTAGFEPIVIDNLFQKNIEAKNEIQKKILAENEDGLTTNLEEIEKMINKLGKENILCIMTTTSCFAPRMPDRIIDVAKLCKKYEIPHVINNAYGVQSSSIMGQISTAISQGRVDAFVQSTDKNFMVPVGGSVIASGDTNVIDNIAKTYAGRASMAPIMDLFVTLLSMGQEGWLQLLKEREELLPYFRKKVSEVAKKFNEKLLKVEKNPISLAMTVDNIEDPQSLGSALFYRNISGPRVVDKKKTSEVIGIQFQGYGSHVNEYPHSYLVMACAIGIKKEDIDHYIQVLEKTMEKLYKKGNKK